VKLLRRIVSLLIVTAYLAAGMIQAPAMAVHPAMANAAMDGMAMTGTVPQDGGNHGMPCKGSLPGCVTELGCMFMVGLAAPPELGLLAAPAWSPVAYPPLHETFGGRSIKPALGPPIPLV